MFYRPSPYSSVRRIPPNPIYYLDEDTYYNHYYSFTTEDNTTAFYAIESYEYTPEYNEEYHETVIRVWLPTHTFSFMCRERYDRQFELVEI